MEKDEKGVGTEKRVTMNIALSAEDKKFLKVYAAQNDTTVAAVIHNCVVKLRREVGQ